MGRRVRTSPRKRPRQSRSKATVDAILEATAQVLVQDGYDKTSTNRVALRAGVSVGSVYQYYPNKEALVGELVDRYSSRIMDEVMTLFAEGAESPPAEMAPKLVRALVEFKRRDPKLARVLREQIPRVGRMQRYEEQLSLIVAAAEAYFTRWREHLRHDNLKTVAYLAVHTVDATTHAGIAPGGTELSDDELVEHVTDILLSYLLVRET